MESALFVRMSLGECKTCRECRREKCNFVGVFGKAVKDLVKQKAVRVPLRHQIKNLSIANKELTNTITPSQSQLRHSNNQKLEN
jgi:hypothetical protein